MRTTAEKAGMLIQAALNVAAKHADWRVRSAIEDIQLYTNGENVYAEPGYAAEVVATGNWNEVDTYDAATRTHVLVSDLPERLGGALERLGVECEWSDQWSTCGGCGRLVRTDADDMSWSPFYVHGGGDITCLECVDPESHLESLQDQIDEQVPRTIDPEEHGYVMANPEAEVTHYGLPGYVAELRRKGVYSAIVRSGRWDVSVWILEADARRLDFVGTSKGHLLSVMAAEGACDPATDWVIGTDTDDAAEIVRMALSTENGRLWADWLWNEIKQSLRHPLPEWQAVYADWLAAQDTDEAVEDGIRAREELGA